MSELLCAYGRPLDLRISALDVRSLPDSRSRRESESAALVCASVRLCQSSEAMMVEAYLARALRLHAAHPDEVLRARVICARMAGADVLVCFPVVALGNLRSVQ